MLIPIVALGAGAYVLGRKHREAQLAKDVAAQSKAAAGFGGSRRRKHHGGIHGDCVGCVGFGAVNAAIKPPTGQSLPGTTAATTPAPQRSTVVSASRPRPAPPTAPGAVVYSRPVYSQPVYSQPAYLPTGYPGGYSDNVGWTAASARAEADRIAASRDLAQDAGYYDNVDGADVVYVDDDGYRRDDYRHRHWY